MGSFIFYALIMSVVSSFLVGQTPQDALDKLMEGNKRYTQDKLLYSDLSPARRQALTSKQKPFAVILGCSDSRVPPELIFDQGLGDLFVVRLAGNVVAPVILDSIEYAAKYLGASIILVLGHENCGAIKAVYEGLTLGVEALAAQISPAIEGCKQKKAPVNECVRANIRYVVQEVQSYPAIKKLIEQKQVQIVGAYYSLESGAVELIP